MLPGHAHDDVFLDLSCGLRAAIGRFDALLTRFAPPRDPQAPSESGAPETVELLLGMIAVRDGIAAVTAVPIPASSAGSQIAAFLDGSLLR